TRVHRGAFNDGQDVALHTFPRNIRAMPAFAAGDLVNLVEENDSGVFYAINRRPGYLVHIDEALLFFLDQVLEGLVNFHLPLLAALPEAVRQHVFDVDVHLLDALVRDDFERWEIALPDFDFDDALVQLALAQLLAQLLARAGLRIGEVRAGTLDHHATAGAVGRSWSGRRQQQIEQALFRVQFGLVGDVFELLFADHVDGDLDQVANHRFNVSSHVADLGELRGFHLQKRRVGELGEATGNLGFTHAGRTNHDDVLGNDFFGQVGREFLAAHAIAQGDGHGALRGLLADHVLVKLGHNLERSQIVEGELFFFGGRGQIDGHKMQFPVLSCRSSVSVERTTPVALAEN